MEKVIDKNLLYIVVPCYNEEKMLPETCKVLTGKLNALIAGGKVSPKSRVLFVNDGSKDRTWEIIKGISASDPLITGLSLSLNRGHQNALLAGLLHAKNHADMVISIDADLQDDIEAMDEMIEKYSEGCDIVYGVRDKRSTDSFFKRTTAEAFYRLMNALGAHTVFNHADYRLMSRRALEGLSQFKEVNLFLRGIVPMIGYRSDVVFYERRERLYGESKYPFGKMFMFAVEGVTSFSVRPIRMIAITGIIMFLVSFVMLVYAVVGVIMGTTVPGWASTLVSLWAIGGLVMLSIGIVGEYIGKLYMESKGRPRFIIDENLDDGNDVNQG